MFAHVFWVGALKGIPMFIGSWRRAGTSRRQAARSRVQASSQRLATPLPYGVVDVEMETRLALNVLENTARRRYVDLQMAIEPLLVAEADINEFQACLRALLAAAIDRTQSGVLITAMRRGDSVAIEIVDDGGTESAMMHLPEPESMPKGATVTAEYLAKDGAKVSLRLPYPQTKVADDTEEWIDSIG